MEKQLGYSLAAPVEYATRKKSKTEHDPEPELDLRTPFMHDRDRIFFSDSFRRLSGKTQVFTVNYNPHARTRLTHTLEVSQLSKTVAKLLNLDIELTEAIAFGHDIGHTPFGHIGEQALNYIMNECERLDKCYTENEYTSNISILPEEARGFKHNWQSLRIATQLEQYYKQEPGLNLTNYTLWGIHKHTGTEYKKCTFQDKLTGKCFFYPSPKDCTQKQSLKFYHQYLSLMKNPISKKESWSFEAFIVRDCDEIAQRHHDIEDGLKTNIITNDFIVKTLHEIFGDIIKEDPTNYRYFTNCINSINKKDFFPNLSRFIITFYLTNLVNYSRKQLLQKIIPKLADCEWNELYLILNLSEVENYIGFSEIFKEKDKKFKKVLSNCLWNSFPVQRMDGYGSFIIRKLFKSFVMNQQQLPNHVIYKFYKEINSQLIDLCWKKLDRQDKLSKKNISKEYITSCNGKESCQINFLGNTSDSEKFSEIVNYLRIRIVRDGRKNPNVFRPLLYRAICDYIASMTDSFAIEEYHRLFQTTPFNNESLL